MNDSQKLDFILANMATKDDIANMATKDDLASMESDLLTEIDRVQEKANNHFDRLERRMDQFENTLNIIKVEFDTIKLWNQGMINLQNRMAIVEAKIS